jgi:cytochrome b
MMRWTRTLAWVAAGAAAGMAFAQDSGETPTDLLGAFGPILVIILTIIWGIWGGFRLIPLG